MTSVSVVIPCHNEAELVGDVIGKLQGFDFIKEIIVVDDGSTDDTANVARQAGADVVEHPYNLGNGAAIKSGARRARGDVIVFMDSDGQHPPEEIPNLLEHIPRYDMVVGARVKASRVSRFRSVGNFILNRYARWIAGYPIVDLTSGFRAIKRQHFLEFISILPQRYSYPTTITIAMFCEGHFVKYVPMPSIQRRVAGKSGIKPFRDGFRFLHIIMRITMLFKPLRVFMPVALLLASSGAALGAFQYWNSGGIREGTGLLWFSGFMCLLLGLLSDQLADLRRRSPFQAVDARMSDDPPAA